MSSVPAYGSAAPPAPAVPMPIVVPAPAPAPAPAAAPPMPLAPAPAPAAPAVGAAPAPGAAAPHGLPASLPLAVGTKYIPAPMRPPQPQNASARRRSAAQSGYRKGASHEIVSVPAPVPAAANPLPRTSIYIDDELMAPVGNGKGETVYYFSRVMGLVPYPPPDGPIHLAVQSFVGPDPARHGRPRALMGDLRLARTDEVYFPDELQRNQRKRGPPKRWSDEGDDSDDTSSGDDNERPPPAKRPKRASRGASTQSRAPRASSAQAAPALGPAPAPAPAALPSDPIEAAFAMLKSQLTNARQDVVAAEKVDAEARAKVAELGKLAVDAAAKAEAEEAQVEATRTFRDPVNGMTLDVRQAARDREARVQRAKASLAMLDNLLQDVTASRKRQESAVASFKSLRDKDAKLVSDAMMETAESLLRQNTTSENDLKSKKAVATAEVSNAEQALAAVSQPLHALRQQERRFADAKRRVDALSQQVNSAQAERNATRDLLARAKEALSKLEGRFADLTKASAQSYRH